MTSTLKKNVTLIIVTAYLMVYGLQVPVSGQEAQNQSITEVNVVTVAADSIPVPGVINLNINNHSDEASVNEGEQNGTVVPLDEIEKEPAAHYYGKSLPVKQGVRRGVAVSSIPAKQKRRMVVDNAADTVTVLNELKPDSTKAIDKPAGITLSKKGKVIAGTVSAVVIGVVGVLIYYNYKQETAISERERIPPPPSPPQF